MPTIEFTCYDSETVKNFRPVLAKDVSPDWWKQMKVQSSQGTVKTQTLRSCPAMDDWLKSGWLLVANRDMTITAGYRKEMDEDTNIFATANDLKGYASPSHGSHQCDGVVQYFGTDAPIKDAFKMRNPWNIVTPAGYSCFYLDPFLFQNKFFATWQGIIDTDKFNANMDNAQIIFYPKVDHGFTILKGTPLCQIIPYKREVWNASYIQYDHETFQRNRSTITTNLNHESMDEWNRKKGFSEQERADTGKTGAYRKGSYWNPKGRFYSEETPPPECPFHVSEDKSAPEEIQLELPIGDNDGS